MTKSGESSFAGLTRESIAIDAPIKSDHDQQKTAARSRTTPRHTRTPRQFAATEPRLPADRRGKPGHD